MIVPRRALGVVLTVAALSASGCTSDTARFCEELRDNADLARLSDAISARDVRGIDTALNRLRDVEDVAPAEIHDDFRTLVDVLSDTVRVVTVTSDSDTNRTPVDPSTLNDQLAKIGEPAQKVAAFADEYCGIDLAS